MSLPPPPNPDTEPDVAPEPPKKGNPWPWIFGSIVVLAIAATVIVLTIVLVGDSDESTTTGDTTVTTQAPAADDARADGDDPSAIPPRSTERGSDRGDTGSREDAQREAEEYLEIAAFSRLGLIEQLVIANGYSEEVATDAVDATNTDWNAQAAKSAKEHMETFALTRDVLVEQLLFEQFTQEEADHGADAVGL